MLKKSAKTQKCLPATAPRRALWGVATSASVLSILLTPAATANVIGVDMQNFNPTTSGLDFVTVQSSETLDPGVINFGFFLNYAVNTLPYFDGADHQSRTRFSDSLLGADINVGIGLLPGWDMGVSAPQVLLQNVQGEGYHGQYAEIGNTEVRVNSKVQLLGDHDGGLAVVGSASLNRIENNPYAGKNPGPVYNLELATDTTVKKVAMGLNVGYRWRRPGATTDATAPVQPVGDQYIASGALSYLFSSIDTKLIFEVYGARPVKAESDQDNRMSSAAEALLGVKHDFTTHLAGHLGMGTAFERGRATPDWRIYAGLNYALGPTYSKPAPTRLAPAPTTVIKANPFAGPVSPKEKIVIHDLLFEFDSDNLLVGSGTDTVDRLAKHLREKPGFTKLIITGHTDSIGSDAYNLKLSQRRADTIRRILIQRHGFPAIRIVAIGRGKRVPIADNGNYQGRQLNRRVEFTIYRPYGRPQP